MSRTKLNNDPVLTLSLHQPAYDTLERIMKETGASSKAEVIRRALEHYDRLLKEDKRKVSVYEKVKRIRCKLTKGEENVPSN